MPMAAFASATAFATGSEGSSESSSLMRATFCAIVKRMEKVAGEPSGAAADLGAALDDAAEAEADRAAATAPPTGDLAAPAVLLLLMSVSDAPPAGDEACRVVVCWLVA